MNLTCDQPVGLLARWTSSLTAVVAIHVAAYIALQAVAPAVPVSPEAPILMDLAKEAVAPSPPPEPPPEPPAAQPPVEPPPPEPQSMMKPAEAPAEPPPPPRPVPKIAKPVRHDAPPPLAQASPPSTPSAPAPPAMTTVAAQQISWQTRLGSHLARFKRYPSSARFRNEQGTVLMRLVVERDGRVVSAAIVRGSGFDDLDTAAGEWVARASPVPAFTADMEQARIEVTVPFRFSLQ